MAVETKTTEQQGSDRGRRSPYEEWVASTGVPVHRGYYVEDVRTLELGEWPKRESSSSCVSFNRFLNAFNAFLISSSVLGMRVSLLLIRGIAD